MTLAAHVLAHYPAPLRGPITPLGNHGGFSGARLFRVESPAGASCLRAWPGNVSADRLAFIHALLRRAAGLDFVPRPLPTTHGDTYVRAGDRFWELTPWMPGAASFHTEPTPGRLRAACAALARLHHAWSESPSRRGVCPGVERRLNAAADWMRLIATGWQPPADALAPWPGRAWTILRQRLPELPRLLAAWRQRPVPLQPCQCDVWHDHVLFTGDRVTGVIDFGSCKEDHVAVDLARLLGSLVGDDAASWSAGLEAYEQHRPLTAEERALAHDLDRTGTVVAAANWLRWLYRDGRRFDDRAAIRDRLAALVRRSEDSRVYV
jgi:Ser/Thr protein kinase RdoA (MazF antagonist)